MFIEAGIQNNLRLQRSEIFRSAQADCAPLELKKLFRQSEL